MSQTDIKLTTDNHQQLEQEQALSILQQVISEHHTNRCSCPKQPLTSKDLCYAGMYLANIISNRQVIEDGQ